MRESRMCTMKSTGLGEAAPSVLDHTKETGETTTVCTAEVHRLHHGKTDTSNSVAGKERIG